MILGVIIIVSIFSFIYILFDRALKQDSKACELDVQADLKGFKLHLKTYDEDKKIKEKNAPSSQD